MIPNQKPYKLVCPKCGFSQFYPRGSVGDDRSDFFPICPKCKEPLKRKLELWIVIFMIGILDSLAIIQN